MSDQSEELKKLELISTARKILNAEYIKQRSDEYNKWLLANKDALKTTNPTVPFNPSSAAFIPFQTNVVYPTEDDVVKRAVELYKLTNLSTITNPIPVAPVPVPEPEVGLILEPEVITDVVPSVIPEPMVEVTTVPEEAINITTPVTESVPEVPEELTDIQLRDALIAEIYKIYDGVGKTEPLPEPVTPPADVPEAFEQNLNSIPQPVELLTAVDSNIPATSMLQRMQELKNNWLKKSGDKV